MAGREACYGKRYTVGTERITTRHFIEMFYAAAGTQGHVTGMPLWMLKLAGLVNAEARAAAGIMHAFTGDATLDGSAIERDTGFRPQVDHQEGIRKTLDWFRSRSGHLMGQERSRA